MALLFGNAAGRSQSKNLLEFKAGKMQMKGNLVHPDKRKGLIYIHQSEDSLMHFCWKDRTSGTVEDDLIIFPDDVEYKHVPQCTTGRVFLLKFKSSNRKCFFWMQDPKSDKDEDNCTKVNEYLNNPPAPGSARSGGSTPGALGADLQGDADLQNLLSTMSQQQFMQLLGGMSGVGGMANLSNLLSAHGLGSQFGGSSTQRSLRRQAQTAPTTTTTASSVTTTAVATTTVATTPSTPSATAPVVSSAPATASVQPTSESGSGGISPQIQLSDLQNILSGIKVQPDDAATTGTRSHRAVDLSTAMTTEALQPILSNPEFLRRLRDLLPQTNEGGNSGTVTAAEELQSTVQSPQFQQAVSMFSAALQSGQLGPLLQQFGLNDEVVNAAAQGDMETFITALQASQSKEGSSEGKDDKDKNDDEDMALD